VKDRKTTGFILQRQLVVNNGCLYLGFSPNSNFLLALEKNGCKFPSLDRLQILKLRNNHMVKESTTMIFENQVEKHSNSNDRGSRGKGNVVSTTILGSTTCIQEVNFAWALKNREQGK
jgi:hypothetical protein